VSVIVLGALAGAALWFSFPPVVPIKVEPPYVVARTTDPGQSFWLEVRTSQPVFEGQRIKLSFEASGATGMRFSLALGGAFVLANPKCEGVAFDPEAEKATIDDELWDPLTKYAQRRPGTGHLEGASWRQLIGSSAAESWAEDQDLIVARGVELTGSIEKEFKEAEASAPESFTLATATLTCTFQKSALVEELLYRYRVRAPDIVVSQGGRTGEGMMRVAYELEVKPTASSTTIRSSLGDATSHVVDGGVVTTYSTDWWSRGGTGDGAILQNGGSAVLEPQVAASWRNNSRLAAGVFATLAIAVASAGIASRVENSKWASK
jgi:hypothetical protein